MHYSITEFETIYAQSITPAIRLATSMLGDEDEARDAVHEVYLRLWESNVRIGNPTAFVIRSVRNACIDRISALGTREKVHRRLSLEVESEDNTDELNEQVRLAMDMLLTDREKEIVNKIYTERQTYKAAAESLGVSVSAINKNIVSALRKLRNHFKTNKS